jgi:hypothetical protein
MTTMTKYTQLLAILITMWVRQNDVGHITRWRHPVVSSQTPIQALYSAHWCNKLHEMPRLKRRSSHTFVAIKHWHLLKIGKAINPAVKKADAYA